MTNETTNLFSRLLLWQKFLILGAISMIMVALPLFLYVNEAEKSIDVAQQEQSGIAPAKSLLKVIQLLQLQRDLSILPADNNVQVARQAKRDELATALTNFDSVVKTMANSNLQKLWQPLSERSKTLLQQIAKGQVSGQQSNTLHNDLMADYFSILDKMVDDYGLSLDPAAESYFLVRSVLYSLPKLTDRLSKVRALGTDLLVTKQPSAESSARLNNLMTAADDEQAELKTNMQKTFALEAAIKNKLQAPEAEIFNLYQNAAELTQKELISTASPTFSPNKFFDSYTETIDKLFSFNAQGLSALDEVLAKRIQSLRTKQLIITFSLLGLAILAALSAFYIARGVTKPVGHLVGVMQSLASGDSHARANMASLDEIGILGRQFDMMVDQREAVNARILQENDTLNNSIINLLQTVARLAQRDLTVRAVVAEDVTGPVSDALNMLSGETAKVLSEVVKVASDVAGISQQIQQHSEEVITEAKQEQREVEKAAQELNDASQTMLEIVKTAHSCNLAAENAINTTDRAQETVLNTIQGITSIRDTIRETEKRIKRLGERSQEIGGIISLINDIAERTHILALNASMHAASAGEAGRGFAVIATEVQKLAENSREATSKISSLVNNIQVETADTVVTMNDAISQVIKGTDLAQKAGEDMRETRSTTANLVQLVNNIAKSSSAQSETSLRLVERAKLIQKSTDQTFLQLQAQGRDTNRLVELSSKLVSAVNVFTLPRGLT